MIKELCSYMYGTHLSCKDESHQASNNKYIMVDNVLMSFDSYQASITEQHQKDINNFLTTIQELKAINNYQAIELEQKITLLEQEKSYLIGERDDYEQRYMKSEDIACKLDEVVGRREEEIENFNKGTQCLLDDIKRLEEDKKLLNTANFHLVNDLEDFRKKIKKLEEKLASSQGKVSTLSDVLNSEPIIEALGKKDE